MGRGLHTACCALVALSACRSLPLIVTPERTPLGSLSASPNVLAAGAALTVTFHANPDVTAAWVQVADANAVQVSYRSGLTVFSYVTTGHEAQGATPVVVHGNNPQGPNSLATTVVFDFTPPALGPAILSTGDANTLQSGTQVTFAASDSTPIACSLCVGRNGVACVPVACTFDGAGSCVSPPIACDANDILVLSPQATDAAGNVGVLPALTRRCWDPGPLAGPLATGVANPNYVPAAFTLSSRIAGDVSTCDACVSAAGPCTAWRPATLLDGNCSLPVTCSDGAQLSLAMRGTSPRGVVGPVATATRVCDATPPVFATLDLTRPARSQLQYTWSATDSGAGGLTYALNYGTGPAGTGGTGAQEGNSPLAGLPTTGTTLSNLPGCRRYYSSVTATDGVGNRATFIPLSIPAGCGNDGTFTARDSVGSVAVAGLLLADFDRDGVQDAAMITPGDGHVLVRYSSATASPRGAFTAAAQSYAPYTGNFIALALGDFDADGLQDIAATTDAGSLVTLHNNGGRSSSAFSVTSSYSVGANPRGIVVADFNADNLADVATANANDHTVSVLLGAGGNGVGNGSFNGATAYSAGASSALGAIVAADVNADHKLDWLAADGQGNGFLVVALGQGDGTFAAATAFSTNAGYGSQPSDLAVADFNHDNVVDVAIANVGRNSLSLLLGNGAGGRGDGTFGAATQLNVNVQSTGVVAADLNADGITDLAVSHLAIFGVGVLLGGGSNGRGDGTFGLEKRYATLASGSFASSLAPADIDGDGLTDLVVGGGPGSTVLSVTTLLGNGGGSAPDGSFLTPILRTPLSAAPGYMVAGDLNADGIPDYLMPGTNVFEVAPGAGSNGQGTGIFGAHTRQTGVSSAAGGVLADLNNDGILDAVYAAQTAQVSLLAGQGANGRGDATFAAQALFNAAPAASRTYWVDAADFNADRVPDLAVADISGQTEILLGQSANAQGGAPQFTASSSVPVASAALFVRAADLNHDGVQDLVVTNASINGNNVQILLGQGSNGRGSGGFVLSQAYTAGSAYAVTAALGDYNGDGATDLAVSSQDGNVWVLMAQTSGGHGNGTFAAPVATRSCSTGTVLQGADLNRDGVSDLVVVCATQVGVLLGNGGRRGNGTFAAPTFVNTVRAMASVVVVDQDADGMLDLLMSDRSGNWVQVAYGSGSYP